MTSRRIWLVPSKICMVVDRPEKDEPDHFHLDFGYLYGLFRLSIHPLQGRDSLGYGRAVAVSGCP
jgi:hypothetical protein